MLIVTLTLAATVTLTDADRIAEMVWDWLLAKAPQYVEDKTEDQSAELDKWVTADPNAEEEEDEEGMVNPISEDAESMETEGDAKSSMDQE
jgi:hypothetical protein